MNKYLSLGFIFAFSLLLNKSDVLAQNKKSNDSLNLIINNIKSHDTLKIIARAAYGELNQIYRYGYWDSISNTCDKVLKKNPSKKIKLTLLKKQASAISNLGVISSHKGDLEKTLTYFEKGLDIYTKMEDLLGVAEQLTNIGTIKNKLGQAANALEYLNKAYAIHESLNNKRGVAYTLSRIGSTYSNQNENDQALKKYEESLTIFRQIKDEEGIGDCLANMANIYKNYGDLNIDENEVKTRAKKALEYYFESLSIYEKLDRKHTIAIILNNIGSVYNTLGDPTCNLTREECIKKGIEVSIIYAEQSLKLREELGDINGSLNTTINLGIAYFKLKNYVKAESYAKKGLKTAQHYKLPIEIRNASALMTNIFERKGDYMNALKMYKLQILMGDSINNENNQKATAKQEARFEYEKQKAVDDAEHDKEIAIEQEAKEKQTILTYATAGGLGLVGIFLLVVFNRLKVTRKQKNIIEEQKTEVEKQKTVVELAHTELEEKNKEITDSIQYAKRIQNAILPPNKVVKEYLQESFIYYKPKDIVAGDFYWLEHSEGKVLFAAADCTGHGVPGAMVSVVCNNGLNRSVREYGLTDPGKILDKTREIVVEEFEKSEDEVKDGMDIALCSLEGNTLKYAGAHNPLWVIRDGELLETKANKQPIGQFDNPEPYTTHTLELEKGDSLYIFSDGYADQFGGEKGKKLKTANFKQLLLSIHKESMDKQKQLIDEAFEKWKGNLEQLDDVCVIGVKI
ncbi:MAG: tetratricopeptide repeat protein [Vicingaceae bacterium]|nr:tetratricopeptide repeat protein [Vicingaceae bacterium]